MPEANVLYAVTAVVVVGLVLWVGVVLKVAKTPWARQPLREPPAVAAAEEPAVLGEPGAPAEADAKDGPSSSKDT